LRAKASCPFGGIDALNLNRCAALDQEFSEGSVAAADVDPAQTARRCQPVEEYLADRTAPDSHYLLIGGAVIETDRLLSHRGSPVQTLLSEATSRW
jgi:hypothetical protein